MTAIDLGYRARDQFVPFHERRERWACIIAHRRAGKTVACVSDLIDAALRCKRPNPRFAYVAPFLKQAKDAAWMYLRQGVAPLLTRGATINETELRVDFPESLGGGRVRIYGADNPDALRGIYLDGVVLDEFGDMNPTVWSQVLRPALSDREGWAVFIGTPKGRNRFHEIWLEAQEPGWFALMLKASQTGLIPDGELDDARRTMTADEFAQEYECSFDAAIKGAYYGSLMYDAEQAGRIGKVPWEPKLEVVTAWDLGIGDPTAIWFAQQAGREVRLIDYVEGSGVGLDWYVQRMRERPYTYGKVLLPHDADVKELGTGKSRREVLAGLGIHMSQQVIVPKLSVPDGIAAARGMLPNCWFDATKCAGGVEALRQYRAEWDDKRQVLRNNPLHDWTSHAADAFRYLAVGLREQKKPQKINYPKLSAIA